MRPVKNRVKVINGESPANIAISNLGYALVANDMENNSIWMKPVVDIGGHDFKHRWLFPESRMYTLIDLATHYMDVSDLPKNTRVIINENGFPFVNVPKYECKDSVAIALYSLTMDDQYMGSKVIEALQLFSDVYITIPNDRLEAYNLYSDAFHGNLECIWTRNSDHLKLMHYWNE